MSKRFLGLSLSVCLAAGCQLKIPFLSGPIGGPGSGTRNSTEVSEEGEASLVDVATVAGNARGNIDGSGESPINRPSCLAVDSSGVVFVGDYPGVVKKVTPDGQVSTVAGAHEGYADGPANAARFRLPGGLAIGRSGDLIVSDTYNNRIRRITPDGTVTTIAGSGEAGSADGKGASAQFNYPADLEIDANGQIFVADGLNNSIRRISPDGTVSTLAGGAQFNRPGGLALDPSGVLYVAEGDSGFLRKVSRDGTVTTIGNFRVTVVTTGPGPDAHGFGFGGPFDVAVDSKGRLLLAEADRVLRVEEGKEPTTLAGYTAFEATWAEGAMVASNGGTTDGPGLEARFHGVNRLAFGPDGALYATDHWLVRKITFRPDP